MRLTEIKHTAETATGMDLNNDVVVIEKAITYLYRRTRTDSNRQITYRALTFHATGELVILERLLLGHELSAYEHAVVDQLHVRFGWVSQDLLQLNWVPVRTLYENYLNNDQTPTEKNKFQQICRTVSIPMRQLTLQRKARSMERETVKEVEHA